MAAIPPSLPPSYFPMFESYWQQLEGSNNGEVNAITAAGFLKKSQLKESTLHKIWDLSDPSGKGYLDKQGFFTALRLVAACQCGRDPAMHNIHSGDPPPKFVGLEHSIWSVDGNERTMYNSNFERLQPVNGLLSGEKVKSLLMTSQLPIDTLGKIWSLSDMDRDGSLDADEFAVAMKLTSLAQKGEIIPLTLPTSLIPPTKAAKLGLAPPTAVTSPRVPSPVMPGKSSSDWVVTPDIKAKYDTYFDGIDKDHRGIVTGDQARGLFMASSLHSNVLAHIWNLCDTDNNGQLNKEQFALAMYLIAEKVKGRELPKELSPQMIPPSKRKLPTGTPPGVMGGGTPLQPIGSFGASPSSSSLVSPSSSTGALLQPTSSFLQPSSSSTTNLLQPSSSSSTSSLQPLGSTGSLLQPAPSPSLMTGGVLQPNVSSSSGFVTDFSAIKELDTVSTEIDSIKKEKQQLHQDIAMKQEAVSKGREEVLSLQGNLEESSRQREQLEKQKQDAQSQLEEIDNQRSKMEVEMNEVKSKCQQEKEEIERLQAQLRERETSKAQQQQELSRLQQQLQDLKKVEIDLKEKLEASHNEFSRLQNENRTVQQNIDQVQNQLEQYRNEHHQISAQLASFPSSSSTSQTSSNMPNLVDLPSDLNIPHSNLLGEPDAISARATAGSSSPVSSISGFSTNSHIEEQNDERDRTDTLTTGDPFSGFPDPFVTGIGQTSEQRGGGGGVSSFDPFGVFKSNGSSGDGFGVFPPVSSSNSSKPVTTNDTFASFPPLNISSTTTTNAGDPFAGSDPFGSDPFASITTPKATNQTTWSGPSPFGSTDPFSSQGTSDPFTSSDPFGGGGTSDPFGSGNPFSTVPSGFSLDPFATLVDPPTTQS